MERSHCATIERDGDPARLVAQFDPKLIKQVFDVSKRSGAEHIQHYRGADDFRAGAEVPEWAALDHVGEGDWLFNYPSFISPQNRPGGSPKSRLSD